MGATGELSAFVASLSIEHVPPEVVRRAELLVLDLAGSIVRARAEAESTPAFLAGVAELGLGRGSAAVFGDPARYAPAGAAFLNAALGHSLDFDDTHAAASLHPGVTAIPAALAAAEMVGASGRDLLAGIIAGYEVTCRLALALPAGEHYARGFHPSATCGVFGAAAAASRVFGLSAPLIASAFGIALSQAAGSLQFLANGAWTKRFQVGWAAMSGLGAACFARAGVTGAAEAFEGAHGFLRAYAPSPDPDRALQGLGRAFELMATAVKPYPSCRYGHAGIDAARALRAEHGFPPEAIERVRFGLSKAGMRLIGEPAAKKAHPESVVDGQFSGPFVIAAALASGRMDWESYRLLRDPRVLGLAQRIDCALDREVEAEFPTSMAGKVEVTLKGGATYTKMVRVPRGEPTNFPTDGEIREKFLGLAAPIGTARAGLLAEAIGGLRELSDIRTLFGAAASTAREAARA